MSNLIYNKHTEHNCQNKARWSIRLTARQNADKTWTYTPAADITASFGFSFITLNNWQDPTVFDDMILAIIRVDNPVDIANIGTSQRDIAISSVDNTEAGLLTADTAWIAGKPNRSGAQWHEISCKASVGAITLLHAARYTLEDWQRVKQLYEQHQLAAPWFCGDTRP